MSFSIDVTMPSGGPRKRKAEKSSCDKEGDDDIRKRTKTVCSFCLSSEQEDLQFGEILSQEDITCHYFCLLLASGLSQNGRTNDGIRGFLLNDIRKEVRRGLRLRCFYCHEKGATLGCCEKGCKKAFHLPCGQANGSLHQFFGRFRSFCDEHYPKQSQKTSCDGNRKIPCSICLSPVNPRVSPANVVYAPCCNNSCFHRLCLQQYAISAGKHHFRCPLCNCRKMFFEEMQTFGIYVPDQDASWERQSGAFEELLERHDSCDAEVCICPKGRNHDSEFGKYDLLLCASCGSFGSHRACRGLVWNDSSLVCSFCAITPKEYEDMKTKTIENTKASDSGSSGHRTTSTQPEEASSSCFSSSEAKEKIIHLKMEDSQDFVDIESDDDKEVPHSDIHVPPFFTGCASKYLKQARSLPSCFISLERIDSIVSLSTHSINLRRITSHSYDTTTGRLIKKNKLKKPVDNRENSFETRMKKQLHRKHQILKGNCNDKKVNVGKQGLCINPNDKKDYSGDQLPTPKSEKRNPKGNKVFPHKIVNKTKLISLQKRKTNHFLMNFSCGNVIKRHYRKKEKLVGNEKLYIQSILDFGKVLTSREEIYERTVEPDCAVKCSGQNENENLDAALSMMDNLEQNFPSTSMDEAGNEERKHEEVCSNAQDTKCDDSGCSTLISSSSGEMTEEKSIEESLTSSCSTTISLDYTKRTSPRTVFAHLKAFMLFRRLICYGWNYR